MVIMGVTLANTELFFGRVVIDFTIDWQGFKLHAEIVKHILNWIHIQPIPASTSGT